MFYEWFHYCTGIVKRLQSVCLCVCFNSHRVEVVKEVHAVWMMGGFHGELQEVLHVQVGLEHGGGPQECRHCRPGPVYASCTQTKTGINTCIWHFLPTQMHVHLAIKCLL